MNKIVIGTLGHVDAGKTTLAESLMYQTKTLRKKGRVDFQDSFLDYNQEERRKGITIFNKEARFKYQDNEFIYIDTPGHNELRLEAKRTLKILDAGIIIISANDMTYLNSLDFLKSLEKYEIPIIIFVNKMDISFRDKNEILNKLKNEFSDKCIDIDDLNENVALENDETLDIYLKTNYIDPKYLKKALINHEYYPVIFGSALKDENTIDIIELLNKVLVKEETNDTLNLYVYKIKKIKNERLTYVKVLNGTLLNKTSFNENNKVNEILIPDGANFISVPEARTGDIVALKGLTNIEIGTYLPSFHNDNNDSSSYLTYNINSDKYNSYQLYSLIKELNDEMPELDISLKDDVLSIKLNGLLQQEIISNLIKERFSIEINLTKPKVTYKETLTDTVFGVGHYEPLRHYGEVLLRLEPSDKLEFKTIFNDADSRNLLNYLNNYEIRGVLTNSPLDKVKITILEIKTHLKHTEGYDLFECLTRAIRQGLLKGNNILLEPCLNVRLISNDNRLINELHKRQISVKEEDEIIASIPLRIYNSIILELSTILKNDLIYEIISKEYLPVTNQEEIIKEINYDPYKDISNPAGSIFCIKGAGHYVEPQDVEDYMHIDLNSYLPKENSISNFNRVKISDEELKRVMANTFKEKEKYVPNKKTEVKPYHSNKVVVAKPLIYLVDGYNLMYAHEEFKEIAKNDLISARNKTIDLVADYKGYVNADVILVFDAYLRDNPHTTINTKDAITIVYTKNNETADTYIENKANELEKDYSVNVVTSDYLEQMGVFSSNSKRLSSSEFLRRYENLKKNMIKTENHFNRPLEDLRKLLEEKNN